MAALVRENPNITVREIAGKMKFADNKSVYYWLAKAEFQGIGQFKQAVLRDANVSLEGVTIKQNGKNKFLLRIPLRNWNNKRSEQTVQWFYFFHDYPNPRGLFATKIETTDFFPWFTAGDIIIINTTEKLKNHSWILAKKGRKYIIVQYLTNSKLYDAITLKPFTRSELTVIGPIISLQRTWS